MQSPGPRSGHVHRTRVVLGETSGASDPPGAIGARLTGGRLRKVCARGDATGAAGRAGTAMGVRRLAIAVRVILDVAAVDGALLPGAVASAHAGGDGPRLLAGAPPRPLAAAAPARGRAARALHARRGMSGRRLSGSGTRSASTSAGR